MSSGQRSGATTALVSDIGLGLVFTAGLAATAYLLADSWGGMYWLFGCAVGVVVSACALARRLHRLHMALSGLAVAGAAIPVAALAELPAEPGPVTTLALSVLVASALRELRPGAAAAVAAAGAAVVAGAWLARGFTTVAVASTAGLAVALVMGLYLRVTSGGASAAGHAGAAPRPSRL